MARTTFARTVVTTHCEVDYIDQNNNRKHEDDLKLLGNYDLETAQKPAIKKLNAKGGVVLKVWHSSYYGKMSIEDFDKYCQKTNETEW